MAQTQKNNSGIDHISSKEFDRIIDHANELQVTNAKTDKRATSSLILPVPRVR